MITIDRARSADREAILAITAQIVGFNHLDRECVRELLDLYTAQGDDSGYRFLVARLPQVIGYACFGPTPLTENVWDLYWLAVDPSQQRHGAGRALMAAMEQEIVAEHARMLLIETSSIAEYQAARRFYESCDYRYQAVIHDFYEVGNDLIVYGKRFSPGNPCVCR
jgi:ribosomal protein S18 acetylase RimI-like enzyme